MRKVKTGINGGFGFNYNDYIYLQAGAADVANLIADMYNIQQGDIVLLTSKLTTDITGQYQIITLTEGYAYFVDRLVKVPAQTVAQTDALQDWIFDVSENVLGGTKTFQDGNTYDTYIEEVLQVTYGYEVPVGKYGLPDVFEYRNYGFTLVVPSASFVDDNPLYNLRYRRSFDHYQFKGALQANTGGDLTVFTNGGFSKSTKRGWLYAKANDGTRKQIAYELTETTLKLYSVVAYDVIYFDDLILGDI